MITLCGVFFFLTLCLRLSPLDAAGVAGNCPNMCSGHGSCDKYARCTCEVGFQAGDCSERICPFGAAWADQAIATDDAHNPAECSNRGICDRETGHCQCMEGFTGSACERLACENDCNNRGVCQSMRTFALKNRDEYSNHYTYTEPWDADKIQGCRCDYPATGYDCSRTLCPTGDDPLTQQQQNEVQLVECIANTGSFVLYYNGVPSANIPFDSSAQRVLVALQQIPMLNRVALGRNLKVSFSVPGARACQLQRSLIVIEFLQQFGAQHPLVPLLSADMVSSGGKVRVISGGVSATDVTGQRISSVQGSKENEDCAGRGYCDTSSGVCSCFDSNGDVYASSDGYGHAGRRGDCGHVVSSTATSTSTSTSTSNATSGDSAISRVGACPGLIACSGHGVCDDQTQKCFCQANWFGGDCSLMSCPRARSWFAYPSQNNVAHDVEATCADMGHCDVSTGQCMCRRGFYGDACQYMACTSAAEATCSGHGQCLSLFHLAAAAQDNGVPQPNRTYGSDPNHAHTWDAHRIHGCRCDAGYGGYDCSQRTCVRGDDPATYADYSEVQLLRCVADNGNFTLRFRGATTARTSFNVTAVELTQQLARLDTIRHIDVFYLLDNTVAVNGSFANGTVLTDLAGSQPHLPRHYFDTSSGYIVSAEDLSTPSSTASFPQYNTSLCDPAGRQVAVLVFRYTHGDLPRIQTDTSQLIDTYGSSLGPGSGRLEVYADGESVSGLTSIRGTTEVAVCNGRGVCEVETGVCRCFDDWTSSDGARQGGAGKVGDCGVRNDKKFTYFDSVQLHH